MLMLSEDNGGDVEHDDADGDDNYDEHPSHGGIAARQHGYGDDAA